MRPAVRAVTALVAVAFLAAGVAFAAQAKTARPPLPPGSKQIAAGYIPGVCTDAGDNGYGSNYGVYFSARSNAWIPAPRCYPRWGNLMASASTVVRAGAKVTVTATPTDGSNSAQYAPETKSIAWTYPGRRVSGCGNADLSCTVIPAAKATKEWQWGEFHVTMPRTFFVDSPGSNCAGQHLCAGFTTNAWAFAGVPPKGEEPPKKRKIKGTVIEKGNCAGSCTPDRKLAGVTVTATGLKGSTTAITKADGSYQLEVAKGAYKLAPTGQGEREFAPDSRAVTVTGADVGGQDFQACAPPAAATRRAPTTGTFKWGGFFVSGCGTELFIVTFDRADHQVTSVKWEVEWGCRGLAAVNRTVVTLDQTDGLTTTGGANGPWTFTVGPKGPPNGAFQMTIRGTIDRDLRFARILPPTKFHPDLPIYPKDATFCGDLVAPASTLLTSR